VFTPALLSRDDRAAGGWQRVPTPGDGAHSRVNALASHGPNDVWLVGDNDPGSGAASGTPAFTEHWDRRGWKVVDAPAAAEALSAGFRGVSAVNRNDAWAVGWCQTLDAGGSGFMPLLEHWDGAAWTRVQLTGRAATTVLTSVAAVTPNDVWAAGTSQAGQ